MTMNRSLTKGQVINRLQLLKQNEEEKIIKYNSLEYMAGHVNRHNLIGKSQAKIDKLDSALKDLELDKRWSISWMEIRRRYGFAQQVV
jgi:endonuclease IV